MELDLRSMHPDVGEVTAGSEEFLAQLEGLRNPYRLDGRVHAAPTGHLHNFFHGLAVGAVNRRRGTEARSYLEAIVVQIEHDDLSRGEELGREQGRKAYRPRPDDHYGAPWLDLAVEHAALEASRQDVAQHDQRLFVRSFGNRIEAGVRVRDAHELGLRAVDTVAENPAPGRAVRVHELAAVDAFAASADAGDQHPICRLECRDGWPYLVDDAYTLMPQYAARLTTRDVALEDMQVGAADRRFGDPDDRIRGRANCRLRALLQSFLLRTQ